MASAGVLSALLASSCCIIPVLTIIAGSTGFASSFSWVKPFRPYLILLSVLVLSFAWYQKLRVKAEPVDCCTVAEKPKFIQSTNFLAIVTFFAIAMMAFPLYSNVFFHKTDYQIISTDISKLSTLEFSIDGMTCASCEDHIEHAVNELSGIISVSASYDDANAIVKYDSTQTS